MLLLDNHIAILTADMGRFIRFYQEAFDAKIERDNPNHGGREGERMVIMSIGEESDFNVFQVPDNTQALIQTPMEDNLVGSIPTTQLVASFRPRSNASH